MYGSPRKLPAGMVGWQQFYKSCIHKGKADIFPQPQVMALKGKCEQIGVREGTTVLWWPDGVHVCRPGMWALPGPGFDWVSQTANEDPI